MYFDIIFYLDTYPWPCPCVSLHQVGLELIHLVLGGGSHGGGVDLVHSVPTQVGGQLDDDRGPPWAPLSDQHRVGGLVGGGNGPGQATHLFYHSLKKLKHFNVILSLKPHLYLIFPFIFSKLEYWNLSWFIIQEAYILDKYHTHLHINVFLTRSSQKSLYMYYLFLKYTVCNLDIYIKIHHV